MWVKVSQTLTGLERGLDCPLFCLPPPRSASPTRRPHPRAHRRTTSITRSSSASVSAEPEGKRPCLARWAECLRQERGIHVPGGALACYADGARAGRVAPATNVSVETSTSSPATTAAADSASNASTWGPWARFTGRRKLDLSPAFASTCCRNNLPGSSRYGKRPIHHNFEENRSRVLSQS